MGPQFLTGSSLITIRPSSSTDVTIPPNIGLNTTLRGIGINLTRDTSGNRFYPNNGTFFDFSSKFFSQFLGSKESSAIRPRTKVRVSMRRDVPTLRCSGPHAQVRKKTKPASVPSHLPGPRGTQLMPARLLKVQQTEQALTESSQPRPHRAAVSSRSPYVELEFFETKAGHRLVESILGQRQSRGSSPPSDSASLELG